MLDRCFNPNNDAYKNYGGRGIRVCERWLDFPTFYADVGNPPTARHSLDRIDPNGDYAPDNIRWATRYAQARNRRNNVRLTIDGETKIMQDWATQFKIKRELVASRLRRGWSAKDAVTTPPRPITTGYNANGG